jgi:hypothetical protein
MLSLLVLCVCAAVAVGEDSAKYSAADCTWKYIEQ